MIPYGSGRLIAVVSVSLPTCLLSAATGSHENLVMGHKERREKNRRKAKKEKRERIEGRKKLRAKGNK
jgi:hypothetical protein